MSNEQIPPQDEADVNDQVTPTSQGEESTAPDTGNVANDSTAEGTRESLIQSLIQKPVEETAEEEAKTEETPEEEDAEEPEGIAESTKTAPEDDAAKAAAGADLEADKRLSDRTRKTISDLRKAAAFGDVITQTLTNAKMTPDEFARWTALAAQVKRGDPEAVGVLIATAKAFGWKESVAAPEPKQKSVDDLAKEIYEADYKAEVDDLLMGEQVARKTARRLAEAQIKSEKTTPEPEKPEATAPRQRPDPIREAAIDRVSRMEADYIRTNPNYSKIAPVVTERLRGLADGDPMMWTAQYQDIVREELRKLSPPVVKQAIKPVAGTQVRSSSAPAPKATEHDPRSSLIADLVAGKFSPK